MNAVIYARYSSHNQRDVSIEQQVADCRDFAASNSLTVTAVYADHHLSGKSDKRPEFQRMIRDAAHKRFDVVICWKVDRFARNREDAAIYKGRLRRHEVRVMYAKESIPEGSAGILLESMLEGTAEWYSVSLSENIKRGMQYNAERCLVNNGRLPLGYCKGPDGRYAIDPAGAGIVKEIFQRYLSGEALADIARDLNSRCIPTAHGAEWNKNSFRSILKNERYTGVYIYGSTRIEGGVPSIVSREDWISAQQRRRTVTRGRRKRPSAEAEGYLLTGKLFCGHCGTNMVGASGTGRHGDSHQYYICRKRRREKSCDKKNVPRSWIESLVIHNTMEIISRPDIVEQIVDVVMEYQEQSKDVSALNSLQAQLADVRRSLSNLLTAIEQGIFTRSTRERLEDLERERDQLEEAIEAEQYERPHLTREQIIYYIQRFASGDIENNTFCSRLIDAFINAIYLYDDHMKIVYNYTKNPATDAVSYDFISDPTDSGGFVCNLHCSTKSSLFKPCSKNFEPDLSNSSIESASASAGADFMFVFMSYFSIGPIRFL